MIPLSILFIGNYFSSPKVNPNTWYSIHQYLDRSEFQIITTSTKRSRILRLVAMLATIIRYKDVYQVAEIDIFSGWSFTWAELSALLLKFCGKKIILTLHGGNLPNFAKKHPKRVQKLFSSADKIISPSLYLKNYLSVYGAEISIIPNPISIDNYPFHLRDKAMPRIIWLRAFDRVYNPEMVPEVIRQVKPDFPDIELIMIGPDSEDGSLERTRGLFERFDLMDAVQFVDRVPKEDVASWLNKGDIYLSTPMIDNAPICVTEAMACGLCVVCTNVGGIPYLLDDEQDSLIVPVDDSKAMASAVKRILEEPSLAKRISENGRKKAETFDMSIVVDAWKMIFRQYRKN